MKRIELVMLLLVFFLASCIGQGEPAVAPVGSPTATRSAATPSGTSTLRQIVTPYSQMPIYIFPTPSPSRTYGETLTPSSTPPGEAAFQSTFNPKTAVTRTRSNPQKCPEVNPALKPDFPLERRVGEGFEIVHYYEYWPKAMEFLQAGGDPHLLRKYLVGDDPRFGAEVDLTGDGVQELVIIEWSGQGDVLTCKDGQFIDALSLLTGNLLEISTIKDMNLDSTPEVVLREDVMETSISRYYIYEWNGVSFVSLIPSEEALSKWFHSPVGAAMNWYTYWSDISLSGWERIEEPAGPATLKDTDGNGTLELILQDSEYLFNSLWRGVVNTYQWNGYYFALSRVEVIPPVYRFQAVEDADRLSLLGKYSQAIGLYQQVISSHTLAAWSLDQYRAQHEAENSGTKTPTLIPSDPEEYGNLAAYALYRIMLLQIVQNQAGAAKVTYDNLAKTYIAGQPGALYAELAAQFWENYSVNQGIGEGCSAAIRYADEHEEDIFTYLGNKHDYAATHGYRSHYYTSWDLCPFQ